MLLLHNSKVFKVKEIITIINYEVNKKMSKLIWPAYALIAGIAIATGGIPIAGEKAKNIINPPKVSYDYSSYNEKQSKYELIMKYEEERKKGKKPHEASNDLERVVLSTENPYYLLQQKLEEEGKYKSGKRITVSERDFIIRYYQMQEDQRKDIYDSATTPINPYERKQLERLHSYRPISNDEDRREIEFELPWKVEWNNAENIVNRIRFRESNTPENEKIIKFSEKSN